jgi:hypothetical protein
MAAIGYGCSTGIFRTKIHKKFLALHPVWRDVQAQSVKVQ